MLAMFFQDYTLRTVALGSALLGIVSGVLGCYAMLRKQSLLGDAISHAALPGIALAFLFTQSKSTIILLIGAAAAGLIANLKIISIVRNTRIKEDSVLGIVLSVFFGFGLVLLTFIQRMPTATQAGLDKFLFGQAATLMERDLVIMAILGIPTLLLVGIFWKEFKLLSFDPDYGATLGYPIRTIEILLTTLIVIAIVIGLQTVGVVLMSAMIIAPAAAARQWTDRMGWMILLAALFGALSGVSGSMLSSVIPKLPTGPTIVVMISAIVAISLLFAPNRGIVWNWLKMKRNRRKLQINAILEDLFLLAKQHDNPSHAHSIATLRAMASGHGGVDRSLEELEARGYAKKTVGWSLTPAGYKEAVKMAETMGVRDGNSTI